MRQYLIWFVVISLSQIVICAPTKPATYDQKQTGEYNIQLHLKDFQIIAVVGDDSLLSGDYDYDYDYADFTIKPPTTTNKTENFTQNLSSTQPPLVTTTKKETAQPAQPFPITFEGTTKPPASIPTTTKRTTIKPITNVEIISTTNNIKPVSFTEKNNLTVTTRKLPNESGNLPLGGNIGQIPVIVQDYIDGNSQYSLLKDGNVDKKSEAVTNVAIVPSEDIGTDQQEQPTLGEILHYRRCAQGYARDKRGRCRKVRRPPQIPLGITRLASNLAAKFRQATSDNIDSAESAED